jgi:DNA-binding NarL/FixJ family response regulator
MNTSTLAATGDDLEVIDLVLVDDHAIVRQGLRSVLEREGDLRVVGEAGSSAQAMAVVATSRPRIVLLDLRLSPSTDTEGIELCAKLTAVHPEVAVLVLTTVIDDHLVLEAIHNGARGYVVKEVDTSELVRAIRAVSRGESAFDSRSAAAMVRGINAETAGESRHLTAREQEVLRLLARGLSNRAIGKQLYISETTAKFHVSNIMRKLQVTRRAEAVYVASKEGFI